jgi:CubicO group peptidase (beta-lactamase class C family)
MIGLSIAAALAGAWLQGRASSDSLEAKVAAAAMAFRHEHQVPGLAVGVITGGRVAYAGGFGVMRVGTDRPVTSRTLFHMASVTKTLVATSVMQLVEAGQVVLDTQVTTYVRDFEMKDPRYRAITVRELLTHTAGMPDVTDYRWDHPEYDAGSLARYIHGLRDSTLIAPPGALWQYSNIGFELLADLVAVVSGEEFESYVQRHILVPLGMRHSTLLMVDVDSTALAWGHEAQHGVMTPTAAYPYNRRHAGSSTLHSDVDDMLRWAEANLQRGELAGQRVLRTATYGELWSPARNITEALRTAYRGDGLSFPFNTCSIGLAWFLCGYDRHRMAFHAGEDVGFESFVLLAPDEDAAIVLMGNADGIGLERLALQLMTIVERQSPP